MPTTFQFSDSHSTVLALADNDVFFVHREIRLAGHVGRAVLFRHTFVGDISNDGLLMRKSVLAESGDNKICGNWES